ncbi:MAG TPA: hypothetical protein EYG94_04945 [Campylobacterales bacterium]|nr:hypothetical protein [Campylobacterales bacterium]
MKRILSVMLFAALGLNAAAIGTGAGTVIANQASLSYSVGGTAITAPIVSNNDVFVVDDKVDLTVVHQDGAIVTVTPGTTGQVTEFLVTNTGNKVHDFILTSSQNNGNPFAGETDNIDVTITGIFIESGATAGYQAAEDTVTYIDELASGDSKKVYIISTIPNGATLNDVAEVTLTAQVAVGGTSNTQGTAIATDNRNDADTAGSAAGDEQIVFADGAGSNGATDGAKDGKHGDTSAYKIESAVLTVAKSSCVVSDAINTELSGSTPHRIPGAVIRYAFEIENAGNVDATNVVVTDDIVALAAYTNAATNFFIESGACACATGGSAAAGGTSGYASPTATLDFETVASSAKECGYFEVEIK